MPGAARVSRADVAFMLRGNRRGLALLLLFAVVVALSEAFLLTAFVQGAAALGRGARDVDLRIGSISWTVGVTAFLVAALVAAMVRAVFTALSAVLGPRVTGASRDRHRRQLLEAYIAATWNVQAADRTGQLQQVFSTSINEVNAIVLTVTAAMPAAVTFAVLLGVAFAVSPPITGILLVAGVVIYLSLRPLALGSRRAAHIDSEARVVSASHVSVVSEAGAEILVLGASDEVAHVGRRRISAAEQAFARSNALRQLANMSTQSLAFIVAAAGLAAVSVFDLQVDFTVLGTIALLLLRAAGQANQVQATAGLFGQLSPFISQVRELTEHFSANRRQFGSHRFPDDFDVALSDVAYAYPGTDRAVVDIASMRIAHGSATAILGPSGSGKSTLIQLLLRLRTPTRGTVMIGGVDASEIGSDQFARHVSFVPQAPHLVPGTVRENIRFFRPWVTDEQIEACARLAHVHDEIMRMPEGYETLLDAHVDMLSGGQKQRISLARALATDPAILVLDEPTSALDARNEALVTQTLADMRGERTVVIITHRESTIAHCDVVLALHEGRLRVHER